MNINTREYWENRFKSGNWEAKNGRQQTILFAKKIVKILVIPNTFSGTIIDFGCGLGDAMPIYRSCFRNATLIGTDITQAAVEKCQEKYGSIAKFIQCDHQGIPQSDIIISCNVFEHLSNQMEIAKQMFSKCKDLYIIVPYNERLHSGNEHVNTYNEHSFKDIGNYRFKIFTTKGWSEYGLRLLINIYLKNIVRFFLNRKIVRRKRMIMFHLYK